MVRIMKNIPKRIYLQTALEQYGETCEDFNDLNEGLMSWCSDKIYSDDLTFISVDFILARIKELEKDPYIDDEYRKHRIKELKNLIK